MSPLARDLRYTLRGIVARPLIPTVIVVTLALGIGANTAIFSVVDAVLLHPLRVPWVNELVVLQDDFSGLNLHHTQISPGEAEDLFARTDLFQSATAFAGGTLNLTGSGEPRRLASVATLGDFFAVFGARPYLGHLYRPEDSRNGNDRVAVLSYAFWKDLTGGDPRIIGTTIRLNDEAYEVVGVLTPEFRYPHRAQLWVPMPLSPEMLAPTQRGSLSVTAVARLRPGITARQRHDQLAREAAHWHERYGAAGYNPASGQTLVSEPFVQYLAGELRPILLVLAGAAVLVLLIACVNVAGLQLVRGEGRTRELTIRAALGADRRRLVQQLFAESLVLAAAGGVAGIGLGAVVIRLITRSDVARFAMLRDARLDPTVLAFTAVVTIIAALLFGTLPARRAGHVSTSDVLKEAAGRGLLAGPGRRRFLHGATIAQVALALVLLLGSGLAIRSLVSLLDTDPGFRPAQVMTMQLSLDQARYPTPASRLAFQDALLQRLRATPGIQSAATAFGMPFTDLGTSSPFRIVGRPATSEGQRPHANVWYVGGDYFRTMGIPLRAGRAFTSADVDGAERVAIIDEALATQFFPGENPIGHQIDRHGTATIVGVVGSVKKSDLTAPEKAAIYYPYAQAGGQTRSTSVAVRSTLPASAVAGLMRAAVRAIDRDLPVYDVVPMRERVDRSLGTRRLAMVVLTSFAALALLLALLGIYGMLSYGISQRRHEIGIRLALGATPRDVVRLVVRNGLALVAVGIAVGIVVFLGAGRAMATILYGVGTRDPLTIVAGVVLIIAAALAASWIPARRAARVDPIETLRAE
ncbi:MAG: ABC transporter permease [Gemmatimonadaceae bacterium]|nr:ABC transporter permease [Gemmatimonadaceae bacterium]